MAKRRILVVDDEPDSAKLVKARLEAHQFEVITASDGEEGLEKAKAEKPDLVILDIKMPKIDGLTFVKRFKAMEKSVPIIVVTAYGQMRELFAMEGVTHYLVKPFKPEELLQRIDECLNPTRGLS